MICILKAIHCFWLMPLKILKNCVEIYQLAPAKLLSDPGLA